MRLFGGKESWVIVDVDGTLCNIKHRLHHIQGEKKDWDSFNNEMCNDTAKPHIIKLVKVLSQVHHIALVTGRQEKYKYMTTEWMRIAGVPYDELHMRATRNFDSDYVIKQEIYDAKFKHRNVSLVIDDRDAVVEMWRRNGLTCLQCQKGDY